MAKYLLITVLLLSCYVSPAQNRKTNIRAYYSLVNQAELSILDSNFDKANEYYKKAFKLNPANDKDIFNAEVVSYLHKDTLFARDNLNKLAYYGMKKMVFEGSFWGASIINDSFYIFISKDYDSIYHQREKSGMAAYGKQLAAFYERDQSVRGRHSKHSKEEAKKSDLENILSFKTFINKNGFPSFEKTGFFDEGGFSVQMFGTFYLVLWHTRPFKTPLDKIMHNAVINGEFRPDKYAYIIDHRIGEDNNRYSMIFEGQKEITKEREIAIDEKRKTIYLEPLADFKKKFNYSLKDKRFELIHPTISGENLLMIKLDENKK